MKTNYALKRLSILLGFLVAFGFSSYACQFQLKMYDSYGDGWNGGKVTVYVNGTAVLVDQTVSSGHGPVIVNFNVNTGDSITTDYTAGSWSSENEYWILDATGSEVAHQGAGSATPGDVTTPIIAQCPVALDAAMVSIGAGDCPGLRAVTAELKNMGTDTLTSATINWSIGGVSQTAVSWTGSLATGQSVSVLLGTYTFSSSIALQAICSSPNNGTDANASNDTANATFTPSTTVISSFPWTENFDSYSNGVIPTTGLSNGWWCNTTGNPRWYVDNGGTPSSNTGPNHDNTLGNSTGKYVFLETSGGYGNTSYFTSPCLALDSMNAPKMEFYYHMYGATMGTLAVEQFVNGAWSQVWSISGQQHSSMSAPFTKQTVSLSPMASKVRFKGTSTTSYTSDMAIDDIKIYDPQPNDLALIEWASPTNGTSPSATMPIIVKVYNAGSQPQDTFQIKYSIDGGVNYVTETYNDTILAGDTLTYTFTTTANMAASGFYNTVAIVKNPGDPITANDTIFANPLVCSPLSGIYTIGNDTADDFNSFTQASIALNGCGVAGPVTILVDSGTYNENVQFTAVPGASATNTITIKGLGDQTVVTNPNATSSDPYIFDFNGAKFFVLDSLTIERANGVNYFWGVHFWNQADSNTVKNCFIDCGTGTSSYLNGIVASGSTSSYSTAGNNANGVVIDNNTINGGYYGITFRGTSTSNLCSDNHFTNNTLNNQYYYGIYNYYQDGAEISGNMINSGSQTSYYAYAIYSGYGKNGLTLTKNKINMERGSYGLYLYRHNYYTPNQDTVLIANNFFRVNRSSSGNGYGIYVNYSKNINIYYNSINITGNYTSSRALYLYGSSTTGIDIKNNIFANNANGYAIYSTISNSNYSNDYNNLYTTGTNLCYQSGNKADLTAWQTASGDALNSVSINPNYFSNSDLHTLSIPMNDKGTPIPGFTTDIDGDTRDLVTPDVGADEYTPPANDIAVIEWLEPLTGIQQVPADTVKIKIANFGTANQSNFTVKYSVDGGQTYTSEVISATLNSQDTMTYTFTTTANFSTYGVHHCSAFTDLTNDQNRVNDTIFYDVFACSPFSGAYTLGNDTNDFFSSFADLAFALSNCGVSGPVTIYVDADTFNENVQFTAVNGASATNTITIKGYGDSTVVTNSNGSYGNSYIFDFNGAKHFVLDSLTIMRSNGVNYFWGVHFWNQADSNTVKNCKIDCGTGTSSNLEGIVASGSLTSYNSNGNNANGVVIDNNTINGGYNGITFRGTSSSNLCSDNHFTNNTLNNQYNYGIYNYYQDGAEISGNMINSGSQTNYYGYAIYSGYGKNGLAITKNKINMERGSYGLYLYRHNYYTPNQDTALIANNFFRVNRSLSGNGYGIYHNYSKKVNYYNNSVNITGNYTYSRALYLYGSSSSGIDIKNNVFANNAGGYAIYSSISNSNYSNDYNNLYTTGTNLCYQSGNKTDLTAWQTASGDAANSISVDPEFFSASDLHTFSIPLGNHGTPLAYVTDDIDGEVRNSTTPDMGADEYTTPANNLGAVEIIYPFSSYCGANDSLYVVIKNFGTATQTNVPVSFVATSPSGAISLSGVISSIASLEMDTVYMGVVNATAPGNYMGKAYATLATDTIPANDTISFNDDVYVPDSIGYSEDFSTWPPTHWDVTGNGTFTWGHSNGSYAYADFWSYTSGNICQMASPVVTLPANKAAYVGYQWAYNGQYLNSYLDTLKIYAKACGDANWTLISVKDSADLVTPGGSGSSPGTFLEDKVQLPASMQGQNVRVMFEGISDYGPNLYIDGITIMNAPEVALGPDSAICAGDTITLDAGFFYGASYMWTKGTDTVGTTQTIQVSTPGTYIAHVTQFGISGIDDITVTVNPLPSITVLGLNPDYCENAPAATLSAIPAGGIFSGNGIVGNDFDPSMAGVGNHDITYSYTDANGCSNTSVVSTMVKPAPVLTTSGNTTICEGTSTTLTASVPVAATDLFFSEYIEGSSNNKALEVYNGTSDTVNLDDYFIMTNYNGNAWSGKYTFPTGTTLLPGDVFVIANNQADSLILVVADDSLAYNEGGYVVGFNGDDVRALYKKTSATDSMMLDIIGLYDLTDPGAGWDVAGVSDATKNHTLVRKSTIISGDTSWANIAGTDSVTSQYLVYAKNDFSHLGSHVMAGPTTFAWSTGDNTASTTVSPVTTSDYYVTATGGNACQSIDTVTVNVLPAPPVNLGADQALCASKTLMLDAGAGTGYLYNWSNGDTTQTIVADSTGIGIGTGNYSVIVTDSNSCNGYDTIALTFMAEPTVSITSPNMPNLDTAKVSWNLTLDAGTGFSTYLWSNGWTNQTVLFGANTLTAGADTSFSVIVTNANGCYGYDTVSFYVLSDVGFGDNNLDVDLGIYPNPTTGKFTMEIGGFSGNLEMNIVDLTGKVVLTQQLNVTSNFVQKFDVSTLAKGVYYIKLISDEGMKVEKLIIQ